MGCRYPTGRDSFEADVSAHCNIHLHECIAPAKGEHVCPAHTTDSEGYETIWQCGVWLNYVFITKLLLKLVFTYQVTPVLLYHS